MTEPAPSARRFSPIRIALLAVPVLFWIAMELRLFGPPPPANRALALLVMMALWWITETLPMHWVALLPLALIPIFPIVQAPGLLGRLRANGELVLIPYVNPFIMLFMGGMLVGVAMERHNLHKRIALNIMNVIGSSPRRILLGILVSTAFISLWISNTATAVMMVPIGMAVISQLESREGKRLGFLGQSIMLAIAYGANIGGIGTLIGTPPNLAFAGFVSANYGVQLSFATYLLIGLPFVLILLPLAFLMLAWLCRKEEIRTVESDVIRNELRSLGPMARHEKIVFGVFLATAVLWMLNEPIRTWTGLKAVDPATRKMTDFLKGDQLDAAWALLAPVVLFLTRSLDLRALRRMPWDVLILLGGSYALAEVVKASGLPTWLVQGMGDIQTWNPFLLMLGTTFVTVFLTAFSANTASANLMFTLVTTAVDPQFKHPERSIPYLSGIAMSASCDFMLPCGTPPNAIVFGTKYVKMRTMAASGFLLDLASALLVAVWVWFGARKLLGY